MGLFGSSKKVYVGTSVSRLIPDDGVPNSAKTGLLKGLFDTDGNSVVDHVLEDMLSSIGTRAEKYYNYGKNHYYYGLPAREILNADQGMAEVEAIVEAAEGQQVVMDYSHLGAPNYIHLIWAELVANHGYDPATNKLGTLSTQQGKDIYLKNFRVVLTQAEFDTLDRDSFIVKGTQPNALPTPENPNSIVHTIGLAASPATGTGRYIAYRVLASASPKYVEVIGVYEEVSGGYDSQSDSYSVSHTYPTLTITFPVPTHDEDKDYFHARYTVGGVAKYWTYEAGTGTYPVLDVLLDTPVSPSGTYFPVLHFRHNFRSMAKSEGLPDYDSSEKLASKLGIDFPYLIDAIHQNPDIADVIQASMMVAVPANSTDPDELRYLFDYFNDQYALQNPLGTSVFVANRNFIGDGSYFRNATVIKDERFKYVLANHGIFKHIKVGKLGAVGSHHKAEGTIEYTDYVWDSVADAEVPVIRNYPVKLYRKQITATQYEEIEIRGLRGYYYIAGKYTEMANNGSKILLIPVDRSISSTYSIPVRERLYARALHFVFNSYVEVKLEWYQQEWFQVVMIVVAIVVIAVTYGQAWQAYAAAIAAGTVAITALLYGLIITALKYVVYAVAIKYFIKQIGTEAAFAIAILATFAAMMGQFNPAMMAGVSSQSLMSFATNLAQVTQEVLAEDFEALLEEQSEFDQEMSKQMKTLESAEELLERTFPLNPLTLFNESPDAFYNRTVHSGNIGLVGISAVSNYVDAALTLPTIDQTIGVDNG